MEWWGWLLAASGGIATIWKAVEIFCKIFTPVKEYKEKVDHLEEENVEEEKEIKALAAQLEQTKKANQAVYKSLFAMMNHMIDGNNIEKLKKAREELSQYIIEH